MPDEVEVNDTHRGWLQGMVDIYGVDAVIAATIAEAMRALDGEDAVVTAPEDQLEDAMGRQREKLLDGEDYGLDRDALTELLLYYSLCPVHRCDYAICFDDEDPECAQVRVVHPGHST